MIWLRANPGLGSALIGMVVAVFMFVVPGRADLATTNLVLAALVGGAFGAAMFVSMRRRQARRP
jgi:hypothetical protein